MLVLSRGTGEKIHIYNEGKLVATVSLQGVRGTYAKLGFEADQKVRIVRAEIDQNPVNVFN